MAERCPLAISESEVNEEDIPYECRECLQIEHDYIEGDPVISDRNKSKKRIGIIMTGSCDDMLTYPTLTLYRKDGSGKRLIEIGGFCEAPHDCDGFYLETCEVTCVKEQG